MKNYKMKKNVMLVLMAVIFVSGAPFKGPKGFKGSNEACAHEGHNKTPGAIKAPNGGVVEGTSDLYIELVNDASGIKLFPMTHDLAPISPKEVKLMGTSQVPKKAKTSVKFSVVEDHFESKVDAKGAYRYTLELSVEFKGKKEKVKFQVEPQN